jgi:predicted aldo/keto reductase-like oxidoreductase
MQNRHYGKTGYDVSLLGMGCMRLPRLADGTVHREKAYELIRYAADHGVSYFDTAYGYHNRTSEEILGEAVEGERRKKIKIATKQPLAVMTDQAAIRKNLENTLKKLRTDYLDVYLIHGIGASSWPTIKQREILREYERFRDEGLIKAIGFSYHGKYDGFREVLSSHDWDMCQVQHNFLDTNREATAKGLELAGEKGVALVIMEPLRGGGLAAGSKVVNKIYAEAPVKRKPVEWGFRYVANFPQVSTILSGMTTLEQLKENIELFSRSDMLPGCLSDEDLLMLAQVKQAYESVITIPCTSCEYCLPCPQKVQIPSVFQRYNTAMMFENFEPSKRTYMFLTREGTDASNCVECGTCETKCPQNIQIIKQLKMVHEALSGWVE